MHFERTCLHYESGHIVLPFSAGYNVIMESTPYRMLPRNGLPARRGIRTKQGEEADAYRRD